MPNNGMPISNNSLGARGLPSLVTEDGPPDKITAFGLNSFKKVKLTLLNGWISQ